MVQELFLKTVFSCMACDGNIAKDEVAMVKDLVDKTALFNGLDTEKILNSYVEDINSKGVLFLSRFLEELMDSAISVDDQLVLLDLAFKTIKSDNALEYSEVKFFKKIRIRLSISDDEIVARFPEMEDYIQPDIYVAEELVWENVNFSNIQFSA